MASKFLYLADGVEVEAYPFDGTVTEASAADFRTAVGAGTSSVTLPIAEADVTNLVADLASKVSSSVLPLGLASGGTGSVNAEDARAVLGLIIGTNVQAWDTQLDSLAGLAYAGNALEVVRVNAGETAFELATVSGYTTEEAQDAVGAMVDGSLTYVDGPPLLQRSALTGHVTAAAGSNTTALGSFTMAELNTAVSDGNVQYTDAQLTSLAALAFAGNANKYVRVNAGETDFEVVTLAGGGDMLAANNLSDVASAATAFTNIKQAASDTATGVIEIAIQSEMETGTDTTRAVTPGRQHFHPSAAKVWCASTQSSTTVQKGYNVASVADTGAGISTITIATDMSDALYAVVVNAEHNSASGTTQTYNVDNGGRAVGTYVIQSWQVDGTEALTDPSASWFSAVFGDI